MPSTFSPALRLELIGNGEQAANWGNTTNTNLGTLLEQAITGVGNITMANANYTLVSGNGVSDEARNAVLVIASGVSLTATRDVIVPTSKKFYAVRNNTTGSQSILVKTSTGTGVTLANGFTQLMYCDGTNVVAATSSFNATTNTVSVNVVGNLTGAASSNVLKAGDTMTGDLTITKISPLITLNKTASSQNAIFASQTAGIFRWIVVAGDSSPESGSNAGSNFGINRYDDAGSYIDTPLSIIRSTGVVNFSIIPEGPASNPTTNNQLARKAYVDTKVSSGAITASGLTQTTSRLLGRTTAGTGAVEEISIGAGLTLSAGSLTVAAGGGGTVTSINVSGGTTGLTTSGGPVTTSGTITLAGTLAVANGGTGATTAAAARTSLGSTTVGDAVFIAATAAAARTATGSAASGAVGSSGVTMNTSRLLGRTTASTGAVEEISVGAGLSFSAGSLALTSGDLQFNSGYGSVATAYGCRAWVNFDGTGTVSIRASGNVSSITDNGAGTYRVNFATALVDANYSCVAMPSSDSATAMSAGIQGTSTAVSTTGVDISTWTDSGTAVDRTVVTFAAFR